MQKNTALATPKIQNDINTDLTSWLKCKPYLLKKDLKIVHEVASIIAKKHQDKSEIKILDIGSGEGSVILNLSNHLISHNNINIEKIHLDCVEPAALGVNLLNEKIKKDSNPSIIVDIYQTDIEEFLKDKNNQEYDVIISCHSLYHINKDRWKKLLTNLKSRLNISGLLFINLVSKESDIYNINGNIESSNPSIFRKFGNYYFGEDFNSMIDIHWQKMDINSLISFGEMDLIVALKELFGQNVNSKMLHFLSFMHRVSKYDLVNEIDAFLVKKLINQKSVSFKSVDKLFVYQNKLISKS